MKQIIKAISVMAFILAILALTQLLFAGSSPKQTSLNAPQKWPSFEMIFSSKATSLPPKNQDDGISKYIYINEDFWSIEYLSGPLAPGMAFNQVYTLTYNRPNSLLTYTTFNRETKVITETSKKADRGEMLSFWSYPGYISRTLNSPLPESKIEQTDIGQNGGDFAKSLGLNKTDLRSFRVLEETSCPNSILSQKIYNTETGKEIERSNPIPVSQECQSHKFRSEIVYMDSLQILLWMRTYQDDILTSEFKVQSFSFIK